MGRDSSGDCIAPAAVAPRVRDAKFQVATASRRSIKQRMAARSEKLEWQLSICYIGAPKVKSQNNCRQHKTHKIIKQKKRPKKVSK